MIKGRAKLTRWEAIQRIFEALPFRMFKVVSVSNQYITLKYEGIWEWKAGRPWAETARNLISNGFRAVEIDPIAQTIQFKYA